MNLCGEGGGGEGLARLGPGLSGGDRGRLAARQPQLGGGVVGSGLAGPTHQWSGGGADWGSATGGGAAEVGQPAPPPIGVGGNQGRGRGRGCGLIGVVGAHRGQGWLGIGAA